MIITKTPFRMSFFGGGTDMEEYFKEHGGAVLSTTFDKYCYVNVRHLPPFFDYSTELSYSKTERVSSLEEIQHPAIREAMKMLDMQKIRLNYEADLPARSGLGTSSSFAVGMLHAFHALKGKYVGKKTLADEAIYLERVLCNESGGWQDQIAAAFGGLNHIEFSQNGYTVSPILIFPDRKKALEENLMLFFTGFTRFSSEVQKENKKSSPQDKLSLLSEMKSLLVEAEDVLQDKHKDLNDFGRLLHKTWELKRKTAKTISTDSIDACKMYNCIYFIFAKYLVKRCTVKHVCLIELNALTCNFLYSLNGLHTGIVEIVKGNYLVTSIKQLNAGMTSDIACTTCYQNSHNILLYWITAFPPQSDNI